MRSIFSSALFLLTACGNMPTDPMPAPVPPTQAQRFLLAPDYAVDLSSDYWVADVHGIVISDPTMSMGPALVPGKVAGQNYLALPGECTAMTAEALAALFVNAAPISAPVSNATVGLVKGVQLPHDGCILVSNCDGSVCTNQTLTLKFQ